MIEIFLPNKIDHGYTLFAEGKLFEKEFSRNNSFRKLSFSENNILILYYTFSQHRRVYITAPSGLGEKINLLSVNKPVHIIYTAKGRKYDLVKNNLFYLNKKTNGEYLNLPYIFYQKFSILIETSKKFNKSKLNILLYNYDKEYKK